MCVDLSLGCDRQDAQDDLCSQHAQKGELISLVKRASGLIFLSRLQSDEIINVSVYHREIRSLCGFDG